MNVHTSETRLRFRQALEGEVERLLTMLDDLDGDPDLEETGDGHDTGTAPNWMNPHPYHCGDQLIILEDDEESDAGEDDGTAEPMLGAPEKHQPAFTSWGSVSSPMVSQAFWADGAKSINADDCESENEHGGDILDEPHDDGGWSTGTDYEPELGWTNHIDQTKSGIVHASLFIEDGEPELGFVGHGTGWRAGEESDDRESDVADEGQQDPADEGNVDLTKILTRLREQAGLVPEIDPGALLLQIAKGQSHG